MTDLDRERVRVANDLHLARETRASAGRIATLEAYLHDVIRRQRDEKRAYYREVDRRVDPR